MSKTKNCEMLMDQKSYQKIRALSMRGKFYNKFHRDEYGMVRFTYTEDNVKKMVTTLATVTDKQLSAVYDELGITRRW